MTSHGLRTVSSSHFGSENDQPLFLITTEEEIPGFVFSGICQGHPVQMEWAHCQRPPVFDV